MCSFVKQMKLFLLNLFICSFNSEIRIVIIVSRYLFSTVIPPYLILWVKNFC